MIARRPVCDALTILPFGNLLLIWPSQPGGMPLSVRNSKREELLRLQAKTLDGRMRVILQQGLGCSAFEAEAVLNAVHEVYFPFLTEAGRGGPPGCLSLVAISAEEPPGKPVTECEHQTINLVVHRGAEDDKLLQAEGPALFRCRRIPDLCQQALSQGALLTREDLAYRIFFVSPRTISRDLAWLRRHDPLLPVPLRSNIRDIGPVLTHRTQIVRLALEGKTMSEICRIMRHSPAAVSNYLGTFTRCAQLAQRQLQVG